MSGRMAPAWFSWVEARLRNQHDKIQNLEESLKSYKNTQKRMLFGFLVTVVINGVILFFY